MKRIFSLLLSLLLLSACAGAPEETFTVSVTPEGISVAESPEASAALQARREELGAADWAVTGQNGAALSLCWTLPDGTLLRENRSARDGSPLPLSQVWPLEIVADLLTRNDWYEADPESAADWAQSLEPEEMEALLEDADGYLTEEELVLLLPQGTFRILRRNITLY